MNIGKQLADMATSPDGVSPATTPQSNTNIAYRPVYKHWFFSKTTDSKTVWTPFSMSDSMNLEDAFIAKCMCLNWKAYVLFIFIDCYEVLHYILDFICLAQDIVITDGGRFDVNISERKRKAVFWNAETNEVRRCSWFYKGVDSRFVPYAEDVAEQLEEEYRDAAHSGQWHRNIPLVSGETVVFHGPSVIVHYMQSQPTDNWQTASVSVISRKTLNLKRFFLQRKYFSPICSKMSLAYEHVSSNEALMNSVLKMVNQNKLIIFSSWYMASDLHVI